jgi:type I restriction-modification system DNA methylase subunit
MNLFSEQKISRESIEACVDRLIRKYHDLPDEDQEKMSEQDVRDYFITPLLEALGWGTIDPRERAAEKYLPKKGFSDYELCLPLGTKADNKYIPMLYVEAKKFRELQPLQKDLFGYDRRSEADRQAIQYADEYNINRGEKIGWAILTNFEVFRLWDTRRGVLVESTEWFNELKRERTLQILYLLSRDQVALDPGLRSLSAFRTLPEIDEKFLTKLNEWRKKLAESVWALVQNRKGLGKDRSTQELNLRDVVQRTLDRLIVIRTAEDRGLLPSQYRLQEMIKNFGGEDAVQLMLLKNIQNNTFKYFDQHYNSKLFGSHLADEMEVHNSPLRLIIEEMCKADFASMNADILGTTYEQYLGQTIEIDPKMDNPNLIPNIETRAAEGIYYTPRYIVQFIVDQTLGRYLYGTENGQIQGKLLPNGQRRSVAGIQNLTLLDPACGSGSFLIYCFDVLRDFYAAERKRLELAIDKQLQALVKTGLPRLAAEASHDPEIMGLRSELELTRFANARIVEKHLYGVDLDPQAAEVASMNLLLKALTRDERLPRILGDNVKVGNSLIGGISIDDELSLHASNMGRLLLIRQKIHEATLIASEIGANREAEEEKIEQLEKEFRSIADGLNSKLNAPLRKTPDGGWFDNPETKRPFNWQIEFPEQFCGRIKSERGFTFVLGNPPYVGFHGFASDKEFLREFYTTASGKFDIYIPFVERGLTLTSKDGELSFICPSTFMKRGFGKKLRQLLLKNTSIQSIHDFLHTKIFREALNYTCICVFRPNVAPPEQQIRYSEGQLDTEVRSYPQSKLHDSPWVFRFGKEEELVSRIKSNPRFVELGNSEITRGVSEGIVTGRNSVLLVHEDTVRKFGIEPTFLRKALRGEEVKRYCAEWGGYYVVYPYTERSGRTEVISEDVIKKKCPNLFSYLVDRRETLEGRTYLKDGNRDWYEIWCPRDMRQLESPKIVVPELADRSQFSFVGSDLFYVDTTCGITLADQCPFDLWYLLGILNSRPAEYLYRKTTVPKANGFLIYKTMYLSTLSIPVPRSVEDRRVAGRIAELAKQIQESSEHIGRLERAFDQCLSATLPLLDEKQQSFKSDYYDTPQYWKRRNLKQPEGLKLTDPVSGISFVSVVAAEGGEEFGASTTISIRYRSKAEDPWKELVDLEPISEDIHNFILLSARRFLRQNSRKRNWKLQGSKASQRTVDVVLGSVVLPIWGFLHGVNGRVETNLRKISEVMQVFRAQMPGEVNPSVLEAKRSVLDQELDDLVFNLYGMGAEERQLVLSSTSFEIK